MTGAPTPKPQIVILHGWGLSGDRFTGLATSLRSLGYEVHTPDLPGFGNADPPDSPWHVSDYARFLRGYLRKHRIGCPVLIGHSFGGRVALWFAMEYPLLVRALVLTGTPGYTPVPRKKLMLFVVLAKFGKFILSFPVLNILRDAVRNWYYYAVGARDFYRASGVMRDTFKLIVTDDLVPAMRAIRLPTLLVWGQDDIIIPVGIARRMNTTIGKSTLVVLSDADHGVSFKQPTRFCTAITPFLSSVCRY